MICGHQQRYRNLIVGVLSIRLFKRVFHRFGDLIKGRCICVVSARDAITRNYSFGNREHPHNQHKAQTRFYRKFVKRFPEEQFREIEHFELWHLCDPVQVDSDGPKLVPRVPVPPRPPRIGLLRRALESLDLTIDDLPVIVLLQKSKGHIRERFLLPLPDDLIKAILSLGQPEDQRELAFYFSVSDSSANPEFLFRL
jgi:hypothetical protein